MSGFVTGFGIMATGAMLAASDGRCVEDCYADSDRSEYQPPILVGLIYTNRDPLGAFDFSCAWWPCQSNMVSDTGMSDVLGADYDGSIYPVAGCNGRLSFAGITRDQYGSPVAGCTVRCYRTVDGTLQSMVQSDANGAFIATTPYYEAHFLTVHNPGPPPIAGASVDTALPA